MTALCWPPILVITDRSQCAEPLEARAAALFRGGCRWLSLREKDLEPAERRSLLGRLIAVAQPFGAAVGIHDDLAAAMACNVPLHLPSESDIVAARRALKKGQLFGKSCHNRGDVIAAARDGADYATLSPFFPTASKPGYGSSLDLAALNKIAAESALPVLALGGITRVTLPKLVNSGVKGVAIMGEAMRTANPQAWFAEIMESLTQTYTGPTKDSPASRKG